MLRVCIPTIRSFDTLRTCIESLHESSVRPDRIDIIDNSVGLLTLPDYEIPVTITVPKKNLGCAASWNAFYAMQPHTGSIIISNDDVTFHTDTIQAMLSERDLGYGLVYPNINQESMFSLFLLQRWAYNEVGPFDENFYPAYFEDNDYFYRMKLKGVNWHSCAAGYDHAISSTLRLYTPYERSKHDLQHRANEMYYVTKWGGTPRHETFRTPFNA